jgi:hypothetical protein
MSMMSKTLIRQAVVLARGMVARGMVARGMVDQGMDRGMGLSLGYTSRTQEVGGKGSNVKQPRGN